MRVLPHLAHRLKLVSPAKNRGKKWPENKLKKEEEDCGGNVEN